MLMMQCGRPQLVYVFRVNLEPIDSCEFYHVTFEKAYIAPSLENLEHAELSC